MRLLRCFVHSNGNPAPGMGNLLSVLYHTQEKIAPLDMGSLVDRQLASREMTFDQLNDSPEVLNALEEEMIEPLCCTLRQRSCS